MGFLFIILLIIVIFYLDNRAKEFDMKDINTMSVTILCKNLKYIFLSKEINLFKIYFYTVIYITIVFLPSIVPHYRLPPTIIYFFVT